MIQKNYFKQAAGVFAMAVLLNLTACGNKGGGNNNQPQPVVVNPGFQQCPNCQNMSGTPLFTAESVDSYGVIRMNWSFVGSNVQTAYAQPQQQPYYGYNYGYSGGLNSNTSGGVYGGGYIGQTQGSYVGQVGVQGTMTITQVLNLGYCQIPAGSYSLGTASAGNWQYSMVSNLRMQAVGPASVLLSLTQGQVASAGYLQPGQISSSSASQGRMFGNLMIESVNGYPCQMSILVQ